MSDKNEKNDGEADSSIPKFIDNKVIITSDSTGEHWSVAAWSPETGTLVKSYRNASPIGHHCLTIVGQSYLIGADLTKPRLHIWALNNQSPLPNFRVTTPGRITALTCTPDGSYIVAAATEKLYVWQTSTGKLLNTLDKHYQTVTCLNFTGDGSSFCSGGDDGLVNLWSLVKVINNCDNGGLIHGFSDHSLAVKGIYLGNFGVRARLISVSLDQTARIYDSNAGIKLLTLVFDVPLTSVCMDIRECNLFVGGVDGTIRQFDMRDPPRKLEHHVTENNYKFKHHSKQITNLTVSTDCMTLLSGSLDGLVLVWDILSRQVIRTINHKGSITNVFFASIGNYDSTNFKPKLIMQPLQRITDENRDEDTIEILSKSNNTDFLNVESYLENNFTAIDDKNITPDENSVKLIEANAEIEKLKKTNAELFKFSFQHILNNPKK